MKEVIGTNRGCHEKDVDSNARHVLQLRHRKWDDHFILLVPAKERQSTIVDFL